MNDNSNILILDQNMVGSAIARHLEENGYNNVYYPGKAEIDLFDYKELKKYMTRIRPEYIFCFAGPHGGIKANVEHPAEFIRENLIIQTNIIHCAYELSIKKMLFLAGSCVYPKSCPQPMMEKDYMTGVMEETSVAYSTARVAGIEMCNAYNRQYHTNFVPVVMCNHYGEEDDFTENGHVLASVMKKMLEAKQQNINELALFGTGNPIREFMDIRDLAKAAVCIMNHYNSTDLINIGGGTAVTIKELALKLADIIGYSGEVTFDSRKPDGAYKKVCDGTKLKSLGFEPSITFDQGITNLLTWYTKNSNSEINLN